MTARTSWSVRADEPPRRDTEPAPSHRPLFADLLHSRFDEAGRLVRATGDSRSRVAERLGRDLPEVDADELEQAVARLSQQIEAAARADTAPQAGPRAGRRDAYAAEHREPAVLDVLDRLEARLEALSKRASRGSPDGHAPSARPSRAAPAEPAGAFKAEPTPPHDRRGRDRRMADDEAGGHRSPSQESRSSPFDEALDSLARQVESLDRNDRSLARAMESLHGQLDEIREGLSVRQTAGGEELALIAERLDALGERLAGAELGPAALEAVERSFEHLLERIDRLERHSERAAAPAELGERLERLRRHVQSLPGREALTALEDRILELAERVDAAAQRGGGEAVERLEGQLEEMAGLLAGLKQAEQARTRDIEKRLSELLRRLEAAPRGGQVDLAAIEARLDEVLARIDGAPAPQFAEAVASLEARLDALGRALEERPAVDLDPLTRQLKQLQSHLDKVSRAVVHAGERQSPDIEPLHRRLEEIQRRLDAAPPAAADGDVAERLRGIEERLVSLGEPAAPDLEPMREQLAFLAERLGGLSPADQPDAKRMTALMERLEDLCAAIGGGDCLSGIGEAIGKISSSIEAMSDAPALEDIAELRTEIALLRREMKSLPGGGAAAGEELAPLLKDLADRLDRQPAGALTLADLEAQVDRIVGMMEEPAPERRHLGPIEESLRRIEEQLDSSAHAALASAISRPDDWADGDADGFTRLVSALSADLGALKETATSSQRDMRDTLQDVHETLASVARRIAALESQEARGAPARREAIADRPPQRQPPVEAAPHARPAPIPEIALGGPGAPRPAAAAAREPVLPSAPEPSPEPTAASSSLLGRLTSGQLLKRATGGRTESFSPAQEEADDGPDLPLEPGSEEPMSSTLENAPSSDTAHFAGIDRRKNRIPGRAGAINRRSADGGYVADDFLSAARRAAQAAAIEATEAERMVETDQQVSALQRLSGAMRARRRLLVAGALAIAVAFAALQFHKLRGGEATQMAQGPVAESVQADRAAAPPQAPSGEPSRPDSAVAFGEPLTIPGSELQRRADALPTPAEESAAAAAAAQPEPAAASEFWPPESIGPEALRQASAAGDPAAQFEVAARYAEGRGVTQDLEQAAEWYRRAAEGGLAPAQYRLGSIYEKGIGVPKDAAAAMEWYRRAAEAGNAKAMHNLAVLYAEGIGGGSDLERAAEWFRRAAEHGVRDSQFNIGVLHARGLGVPQDMIEAYKWFSVAAQSGDSQAAERRNVLASSMPEQDLTRARAAAAAFRPLILDPAANVVEQPEGGWGDPPSINISLGSTDLVRQVQDLLAARGFDVGPADGRFGPRTRSALAAFQEELGLPATGEIDAGVVVALQQAN
jgi:localization factor PodJL